MEDANFLITEKKYLFFVVFYKDTICSEVYCRIRIQKFYLNMTDQTLVLKFLIVLVCYGQLKQLKILTLVLKFLIV